MRSFPAPRLLQSEQPFARTFFFLARIALYARYCPQMCVTRVIGIPLKRSVMFNQRFSALGELGTATMASTLHRCNNRLGEIAV